MSQKKMALKDLDFNNIGVMAAAGQDRLLRAHRRC